MEEIKDASLGEQRNKKNAINFYCGIDCSCKQDVIKNLSDEEWQQLVNADGGGKRKRNALKNLSDEEWQQLECSDEFLNCKNNMQKHVIEEEQKRLVSERRESLNKKMEASRVPANECGVNKVNPPIVQGKPVEAGDVEEASVTKTNFALHAECCFCYIDREGKEIESLSYAIVRVDFFINGKTKSENIEIKMTNLDSVITLVKKRFPYAVVGTKVDAMINDLRIQTFEIPIVNVCTEAGWNKIGNRWMYCMKGVKIDGYENRIDMQMAVKKGYSLTEASDTLWRVLHLYNEQGISGILILFSLLGVMYKPFEDAGYPIRFLLFIKGQTGSYKTSIAKELYMQLVQDGFQNSPRRLDQDTEVSLERALVTRGRDTITFFDDFCPAKTENQKNKLFNNFEIVVRMVGDGVSKNRSNANLEDVRGKGVKGCVVITGEIKGIGHSSQLRCLFVDIKKRFVNTEYLSWLQANKMDFNTFVWNFTNFITENWHQIQCQIKADYLVLRQEYSKEIREARLVDAMVVLHIMLDLLKVYCIRYLQWQDAWIDWLEGIRKDILTVVKINDNEGTEQDPIENFMNGLRYTICNRQLLIVDGMCGVNEIGNCDGFVEGDYIYLKPENVYHAVSNYLKKIGLYMAIDYRELYQKLMEENILCRAKNGKNRSTPYFRRFIGKTLRIQFIKMKVNYLLESEEE